MRVASNRGISKILFLYVTREALFSFFVCFLFFFFIFFVNQILYIAQQLMAKRVPISQVMQLVIYSLPIVISMSAPFAALTGVLMTVGRLSSDNEILVMLSSGLPYRTVFVPAILFGIVISVLSFLTNDILLPLGMVQYNKLYRQIAFSTPELELESNSVKRFKDTTIILGNVTKKDIQDIIVLDRTGDGERRMIMAKNAHLNDGGRQGLSLDMDQAFILSSKENVRRNYDYASAGKVRYWVPQEDIIQSVLSISVSEMSSRDVLKDIRKRAGDVGTRLNDQYIQILPQMMQFEEILRNGPQNATWNQRASQLNTLQNNIRSADTIKNNRSLRTHRAELYKKFSIPSAALCFIFLAVPLGLLAKKSGQTVGFFFGLIIAVLYWSMLFVGQTMVQRIGTDPLLAIWFSNVSILLSGLILCAVRIRR
ncbi:MAG: LptF/LptG family permease [Spirochaetaceae bacterium]|nr:LptF/LptG family permease [Spirochaetaceae bacterium]